MRDRGHGIARVLSKLGVCSRTQAAALVVAGRVCVDGVAVTDPERRTRAGVEQLSIDGVRVEAAARVHVALNKPRGLVVSAADERGRDTVYSLLAGSGLPWLAPVGRLDRASEGLLLLANDPAWAAAITGGGVCKTYHVQVAGRPGEAVLDAMRAGVVDRGELLRARGVTVLRAGVRNAWLEVVLDEGRNRHIRRLLDALGHPALRLVRVAIGPVLLGDLAKGAWRLLAAGEVEALSRRAGRPRA